VRARSRVGALVGALAALALVLSACAGDLPRPRPSATALPTGVSASIVQLRSDVADRQAQLQVHNSSEEVLLISAVRVDDPRFAGVGRRITSRTSSIAPGATVDIRIQLPLMKCTADDGSLLTPTPTPTPTPEPVPQATATAGPSATPGGSPTPTPSSTATITGPPSTTTVTVHYQLGASIAVATEPVVEPVAFLADLYARECLAERLSKAASLTISSFTPSPAGQPADLALNILPTGNGVARIVGIETTNLLTFDQGAGATADLYPIGVDAAAAGPPVVVHLPLVPLRCDAHAVQEDKRGTVFTIAVELDGEPGEIELPVPADIKGQILTWIGRWCGFGS
jgi:hypothetical protein